MVRKYKSRPGSRSYRNYDDNKIDEALIEIIEGRLSITKATAQFKIPYGTLHNKFHGRHFKPVGTPTVFPAAEEDRIVKCLQICGDWGFPLDREDLKSFVQTLLISKGIDVPQFKDCYPGSDWVECFLKRHSELRVRRAGNIIKSRAEVSIPMLTKYFEELKETVDGVPPPNIYNMDESAFNDDPECKKLLFRKGTKHAANIQNHSKSNTTVVMCGSADGVLLPPYIIYKSEYVYPTWVEAREKCKKYCQKDCCSAEMRYNSSKSGWINPIIFEDWYFRHFLPHAKKQPGKKVLTCDNLSSHFTERVIQDCIQNDISFVPLLPNSTHLLQPLDVAFFRPMKVAWRRVLRKFKMENKKTKVVPKSDFPDLLHSCLEAMDTIQPKPNGRIFENRIRHNLISAFSKAGISPFNPKKVLEEIPGYKTPTANYTTISGSPEESALVALLKEQRCNLRSTKKTTAPKGKKFNVTPGKSVTMADTDINSASAETESASGLSKTSSKRALSKSERKSASKIIKSEKVEKKIKKKISLKKLKKQLTKCWISA